MFKEVDIYGLTINPPTEFGKNWMLLTAGNEEDGVNSMTIAWGHIGSLWGRAKTKFSLPTAICYVRPTRHTKKFIDSEEYFTLCSFPNEYKRALGYMGSHSGRDGDKAAVAGLTPVFSDGTTYYEEASRVYIVKKLYHAPLLEEGFVEKDLIDYNYPQRDFHEMYIGEIVKILEPDAG